MLTKVPVRPTALGTVIDRKKVARFVRAATAETGLSPSSRIRRPKAVFLATGAHTSLIFHADILPQQLKTAVVKTYPIPMP